MIIDWIIYFLLPTQNLKIAKQKYVCRVLLHAFILEVVGHFVGLLPLRDIWLHAQGIIHQYIYSRSNYSGFISVLTQQGKSAEHESADTSSIPNNFYFDQYVLASRGRYNTVNSSSETHQVLWRRNISAHAYIALTLVYLKPLMLACYCLYVFIFIYV